MSTEFEFRTAARRAITDPNRTPCAQVSLSRWVNERFPAWDELLTARDVARLTRRHRWLVSALTLLGKFPKKHAVHGRRVFWGRCDVQRWLETHARNGDTITRPVLKQARPPLRCRRGGRAIPRPSPCSTRRNAQGHVPQCCAGASATSVPPKGQPMGAEDTDKPANAVPAVARGVQSDRP